MTVTLADLAVRFGCELRGDPARELDSVATLQSAGRRSIAFLANPHYRKQLAATRAGCVVLREIDLDACPVDALISADPYLTYAGIAAILYPPPPITPGVHDTAVLAPGVRIADSSQIGANVHIGEGTNIGERVVVGANSVIGETVSIGADTRIFANTTIYDGVSIGERCRVHSGAVIGADGFGIAHSDCGWQRVPQLGSVRIGNDVDIGANTCIDRGAIEDTVIDDGVKLDNLVQIAHNVRIGAHTAMAAQVGIAGSAVIGKHCLFAGHSGTVGHVQICDRVVVSGKTMVTKNINRPGQYGAAMPAEEMRVYRRNIARIRQLDKMARRLVRLENALNQDLSDD